MIKHTLFAIALGFILFFLYLFQYTGAFKTVTINIDNRGPYLVVYKNFTGPYHKTVSQIEVVEKWAQENGLKCRLSFGQYFDDPRIVEEGRLTSRGGCLIDTTIKDEVDIFSRLKDKMPQDFKFENIAESKAVVALFTGAPSIGPMKVYPAAEEFIQNEKLIKKGSVIEIYEVFNKNMMQTIYIWPVQD